MTDYTTTADQGAVSYSGQTANLVYGTIDLTLTQTRPFLRPDQVAVNQDRRFHRLWYELLREMVDNQRKIKIKLEQIEARLSILED